MVSLNTPRASKTPQMEHSYNFYAFSPALFIQGLSGDPKPWPFSCSADAADSDSGVGPCSSPTTHPTMRTPVCWLQLNHECRYDLFPVPGALQSAQTSVLCSFLDISTEAGDSRRRMMSAAPALRCIHPQSPHPNNTRNLVSGPTDVCRQLMRRRRRWRRWRLPQNPPRKLGCCCDRLSSPSS